MTGLLDSITWLNFNYDNYMQDKRLKELFDSIPSLDELHALGGEGYKADIILVDTEKDKKLSMLKQLIMALVKGLNSNPAAMIRKIAGLVKSSLRTHALYLVISL